MPKKIKIENATLNQDYHEKIFKGPSITTQMDEYFVAYFVFDLVCFLFA